jgi:hypothetical protein
MPSHHAAQRAVVAFARAENDPAGRRPERASGRAVGEDGTNGGVRMNRLSLSTALVASMFVAGAAIAQTPPPGNTAPQGSGTTAVSPSGTGTMSGSSTSPNQQLGTSGSTQQSPTTTIAPGNVPGQHVTVPSDATTNVPPGGSGTSGNASGSSATGTGK